MSYIPTPCQHCENAPCIGAARDNAVYRRDDGLAVIDPERARGQRQLVEACPYGKIYYNEELDLPQKCTGCAHLLDGDFWLRGLPEEEFEVTIRNGNVEKRIPVSVVEADRGLGDIALA